MIFKFITLYFKSEIMSFLGNNRTFYGKLLLKVGLNIYSCIIKVGKCYKYIQNKMLILTFFVRARCITTFSKRKISNREFGLTLTLGCAYHRA